MTHMEEEEEAPIVVPKEDHELDRALRKVQLLPTVSKVLRYLGEGSFAHVFLCKLYGQDGEMAVKLLKPQRMSANSIRREIAAGSLFEHPNLNRLYGARWGHHEEHGRCLPETCGAQYLHAHSFVHRDIKPENCLLSSPAVPFSELPPIKLGDFGLCRLVDADLLMSSHTGTPWYMAPEVMDSNGYGCPADIYSWSILCHEVCTGTQPFGFDPRLKRIAAFTLAICRGTRPRLEEIPHFDGAEDLRTTLPSAWNPCADDRPSGEQLVATLERIAG